MKMRALLTILFLALFVFPRAAYADSWVPPSVHIAESRNGQWQLIVVPGADAAKALSSRERAEIDEAWPSPVAILRYREYADEDFYTRASFPLVNDVLPVDVYVSDDGNRIVTLDDWYSLGTGGNVVVVYDGNGQLLRAQGLLDILPKDFVDTLPMSISSVWWRGDAEFGEGGRTFRILVSTSGCMNFLNVVEGEILTLSLEEENVGEPADTQFAQFLAARGKHTPKCSFGTRPDRKLEAAEAAMESAQEEEADEQ